MTYDFTLFIDRPMTGTEEDRLFEVFEGDASPGTRAGRPYVDCSLAAPNQSQALGRIVKYLLSAGFQVHEAEYHGAFATEEGTLAQAA